MSELWQILHEGKVQVSTNPEALWNNAADYFRWCDQNPIKIKRTILTGKAAGSKIETEQPRPYSIKGLCVFCGILQEYLQDIRNSGDKSSLYYVIVSKILYIIYEQNSSMAMIGEYSPVFTAKVLNMEKDDAPISTITVNVVGGLPSLSNSENQILEKLESEKQLWENAKDKIA